MIVYKLFIQVIWYNCAVGYFELNHSKCWQSVNGEESSARLIE